MGLGWLSPHGKLLLANFSAPAKECMRLLDAETEQTCTKSLLAEVHTAPHRWPKPFKGHLLSWHGQPAPLPQTQVITPMLLRIPPPKQTGGGSGSSGSHVAFQFCGQPAQLDPEATFASLATALINYVTHLTNGLIILFLGFLHL